MVHFHPPAGSEFLSLGAVTLGAGCSLEMGATPWPFGCGAASGILPHWKPAALPLVVTTENISDIEKRPLQGTIAPDSTALVGKIRKLSTAFPGLPGSYILDTELSNQLLSSVT